MNHATYNSIRQSLNKYYSLNLEQIINSVYDDEVDLNQVMLTHFNIYQFVNLTHKVFDTISKNLTEENFHYYSNLFYINNDYGSNQYNLLDEINNFLSHLETKTKEGLNNSESVLRIIMNWTQIYNFYEILIPIEPQKISENIKEYENKLKLLLDNQDQNNVRRKSLFDELEVKKVEIVNLIAAKTEELEQIKNKLDAATLNTNSINDLLTKNTETTTNISNLLSNFEKDTNKAQVTMKEEKIKFEESNANMLSKIKSADDQIDEFQIKNKKFAEDLKFVESKKKFFEERNDYLVELIGREGGAALFETFRIRQKELEHRVEKYLKYVMWTSIGVFIITTVIFIMAIDYNKGIVTWELVISSISKSIPLGVFLYFVIRQYIKERNYTEEYAFKAACALTVKSYRDILKDDSKQDDLIVKAVLEIYKTPFESQAKDDLPDKKIKEMFLNMTETTKNLSKK